MLLDFAIRLCQNAHTMMQNDEKSLDEKHLIADYVSEVHTAFERFENGSGSRQKFAATSNGTFSVPSHAELNDHWSSSIERAFYEDTVHIETESPVLQYSNEKDSIDLEEIGRDVTVWNSVFQRRPGARHGRGGRKPTNQCIDRRANVKFNVFRLIMIHLSLLFNEDTEKTLDRVVRRISQETGKLSSPNLFENERKYSWHIREDNNSFDLKGYQRLDAPVYAACHRVGQSEFRRLEGSMMERHVACFWIGSNGDLHCTCVGSSKFRIGMIQDSTESIGISSLRRKIFIVEMERRGNRAPNANRRYKAPPTGARPDNCSPPSSSHSCR